jgi:hypothetical protein
MADQPKQPNQPETTPEPGKAQRRVEEVRRELDHSVGELRSRGQRARKPLVMGAAALAVAGVAGVILWRVLHRRRTAIERVGEALRRIVAHPDRVAEETPSVGKKVLAAAASAAASVLARRLAQRLAAR